MSVVYCDSETPDRDLGPKMSETGQRNSLIQPKRLSFHRHIFNFKIHCIEIILKLVIITDYGN